MKIRLFFLIGHRTRSMSTTTENADLIVEIKSDRHWHIVLNRPDKYNAISLSMYKTMIEVLDRAGKDPHLTLLTIVGKGKYFSAGTDLSNPIRTLVRCFVDDDRTLVIFSSLDGRHSARFGHRIRRRNAASICWCDYRFPEDPRCFC